MKKITLLLLLLVSTTLIFAQENHKKCITTKLVEEELKNNTDYVDARQNAGKINYNSKERKTNNIPVVIHIIHRTSHANIGSGTNIPDIQIEDALRILNEDFSKNLIRYVEIGDEANLNNSLGFGTKKLTEIALRALPPTATDPATACFCIDQLGEALKGITTILAQVVYSDEQNNVRHIAQKEYFSRILFDHFAQIKLYGFNDVAIIKSTLTAFIKIAEKAESNQNKELWEFTMFMLENTSFLELHKYNINIQSR